MMARSEWLTVCIVEFNVYNGYLFDIKARSLNSLLYWVAQIVGSILMAFLFDRKSISRRTRAFLGWSVLFVLCMGVHIWGYFYQKDFKRPVDGVVDTFPKTSIGDSSYAPKVILYIGFGLVDAMWQITVYWIMGAMSNDPRKLAHFTGLCECSLSLHASGWRAHLGLGLQTRLYSLQVLLVSGARTR